MHVFGSRSGRHRRNVAACRNRPYWIRSNATSQTRTGCTVTHAVSLPADHRLCPPGSRPPREALRALLERPEELPDLAPLLRPERRRVSDVVQRALVVVETEEQ